MANPKHLSKLKEGAGTLVRALGQLLQKLRSVSTSAPAGNICVKPNMVMPGHMARFQTPVRVWDRERRLGPTFVPGHTIATSTGIDQGRSARKVESKTRRTESGPPQRRHT